MQIAQALSGYSLGEADMLRRAMGKKIKKEMDAQRARFVDGAVERGDREGQGRRDLRPARQIRRLRLQQEPRGGLCADRLLDRLVQGEPSGRVPRRLDDARQGQHRQARRIPRRGAAARHPGRAAVGQRIGRRLRRARRRRRRRRRSSTRSAPSRASAKRRRRRWRGARRQTLRLARRHGAPARPAPRQQEGARKPRRGRRVRRTGARPRRRLRRRSSRCWRSPTAARRKRPPARTPCSAKPRPRPLKVSAAPWTEAEKLKREFDAVGFFLSGHPLEAYDAALKRLRAERWADFARSVRAGASTARLGASVLDRAERRTKSGSKMGIVQLSDPSGQYEAIIFQEGLNQYRDLLEKGADVLVTLQANVEGEDVRARIVAVERLNDAAAKVSKGLRIFVRDDEPARLDREPARRAGRRRGVAGRHARAEGGRGRDPPARPLRGQPGGRRRAQGRAGRGGGRGGLARPARPARRFWRQLSGRCQRIQYLATRLSVALEIRSSRPEQRVSLFLHIS